MNRYRFRVQYSLSGGHTTDEPHCIRAETESAARTEVDEATERYPAAVGATKTIELLSVTAEA